ncbi:lysine--tRNA ligase [Acidiphilium sp. AL]|uniref:lysine--tRNA ligase n=1 Tax=Acidiphilium sp. AL TaxID=2871704 RepID=UPI0021CB591B|nr:lysine--tRNA ligase [Acidiphilium sp. AL]MCU4160068.1 lysine--tRNA ligase [Acidiphilium sp. AL]
MIETTSPVPTSWPFREAERVAQRLARTGKTAALFETGYGPSGLPHIGTFMEVARTSWIRHAFTALTGLPSKLLAFSDDMDALRKVPGNVPNQDMLRGFIGQPLTRVPDPFGTHPSFGAHNNARLRAFLDSFGFDYEFASSTEYYGSGRFNAALRAVAARHDAIRAIILPTLGPERRATYSPFLPLHPRTGVVMQVAIEAVDVDAGTVTWRDPDSGTGYETSIYDGAAKLQWKADWAMRWFALGVDYEMSGKDLIDSVRLSSAIVRALDAEPPETFTYELFLDQNGQKISKSKGNGLSVEQWLSYAPPESLGQFMFGSPQRAKRLYFDVIPRATDEYIANVEKAAQEADPRDNPAWHIHAGDIPQAAPSPVPFGMLLNLATVVNAETPDMLWGFIHAYKPDATPRTSPFLARLVDYAVRYYQDFIKPAKRYRAPSETERAALEDLAASLRVLPEDADADTLQTLLYDVGKRHDFAALRDWFSCLYQVLLGQSEGPRFGPFIALYGVAPTVALIEQALSREAAEPA